MSDVDVVIPAYESPALFERALRTVLAQDGVAVQVIVSDDSRSGAVADIVAAAADERIVLIRNTPSLGAVKNWNSGLAAAHSEFVMLLHHDEYLPDRSTLANALAVLRERKADLCVTPVVVQTAGGGVRRRALAAATVGVIVRWCPSLLFVFNAVGPTGTILLRRTQAVAFDEGLKWLVDVDWYYRLLRVARPVVNEANRVWSEFGHDGQITSTLDILQTLRSESAALKAKYGAFSLPYRFTAAALLLRKLKKVLRRYV